MEPGFVAKIHFARYDRRELDTYYRASWIFDTVPGGNGSIPFFGIMLFKIVLDLNLVSITALIRLNILLEFAKISLFRNFS